MKLINTIFLVLLFANLQAQQNGPLTAKGSGLLATSFSFSAQGGDLYENQTRKQNSLTLDLSYLHFISNRFGVGAEAAYSKLNFDGDVQTSWIGAFKAGYFFDYGKKTIPYLSASVGYQLVRSLQLYGDINGFRATPAIGILINKKQIGISLEVGVYFDQLVIEDKPINGHTIYLGFGVTASLFSGQNSSTLNK